MSEKVRNAFRDQIRFCDQLGSPFTARVCRSCLDALDGGSPIARAIVDWPGDPSAHADSLPLRVAGALHHLARSGGSAALRAAYPPNRVDDDALRSVVAEAFREREEIIRAYLASPPQTNEVMRSAALLPGMLTIAQRTQLPLELYEIGSSAGLNLILDRYRYEFGSARWGDPRASLLIKPEWRGGAPPVEAPLQVVARNGVDLNPIALRDPAARERLLSYVWPDQVERLQRLEQAIAIWLRDPPGIVRADAAQWLERSGIAKATPGVTRVLFHSVTWSYLSQTTKQAIVELLQRAGEQATQSAPLAWLRFELTQKASELRLSTWPGTQDELLATGHPHGTLVNWA
ncbi:MAG TPA: DUF2332 family protein [Nevskiaceae bacterium]|nr:DUF2332 family protein [Nevskiaceae bacterium]